MNNGEQPRLAWAVPALLVLALVLVQPGAAQAAAAPSEQPGLTAAGTVVGVTPPGDQPGELGALVDRAPVTLDTVPNAKPTTLPGPPQQRHWRDKLCYGFPGCPDSFLFLIPVLVVGVALRQVRSVYALAGIFLLVFIVTAVLLDVNILRVIIYISVAVAVGVVWLVFGGLKR